MLRNYDATRAYNKIKDCSAFNVAGYVARRKLNGHATLYTFRDGSKMLIKALSGCVDCWHPDWKGLKHDIHLGPIKNAPLKINR